jgi:hypothetical protein
MATAQRQDRAADRHHCWDRNCAWAEIYSVERRIRSKSHEKHGTARKAGKGFTIGTMLQIPLTKSADAQSTSQDTEVIDLALALIIVAAGALV